MKLKKRIIQISLMICLLGLGASLYIYYKEAFAYEKAQSTYKEINELKAIEPVRIDVSKLVEGESDKIQDLPEKAPISSQNKESESLQEASKTTKRIAFEPLKALNEDIIAWIEIPNTPINYPITQTHDNAYYLTHLANKEASSAGSIFMDMDNAYDFSDQNTRLYGHHMKDGSMFAALMNYKNQSYYDQHKTMMIYTPDRLIKVTFFAGCLVDGSSKANVPIHFDDEAAFNQFIKNTSLQSSFESGIEVTDEDTLISLVTCDYDFYDARYVLYGKIDEVILYD